jgi:hypothetical protein
MFTRKLPLSLKFVPHAQPLITPSSCAHAVSPLVELIKPTSKRSKSANAHLAPGLSAKLLSAEMAPTPLKRSKLTLITSVLPPERQLTDPKPQQPGEPPPEMKSTLIKLISFPLPLLPLESSQPRTLSSITSTKNAVGRKRGVKLQSRKAELFSKRQKRSPPLPSSTNVPPAHLQVDLKIQIQAFSPPNSSPFAPAGTAKRDAKAASLRFLPTLSGTFSGETVTPSTAKAFKEPQLPSTP